MSGGYFDYAHSEMAVGELDKFQHYADRFLIALRELHHLLEKRPAGPERERGSLAVLSVIAAFEAAKRDLASLEGRVKELAGVAHDIEWWKSCDYSAAQAVEGCVEFLSNRIGLDLSRAKEGDRG